MNSRPERKGFIRVVKACFDQLRKNPDLKEKWISSDSWLQLMKESTFGGEIVKNMKLGQFTKLIKKEYSVRDNSLPNNYGIYMRKKKVRNGRNHKAQILTCFLVTEPERLPSENESQWYHIITAIDPLQASPSPANSPASSSPADSPASSSPSSSSSTSPVKTHTQLQPPATCTQLQSSSESTST